MNKLEQWLPRTDKPWDSIKQDVEDVMTSYWNIANDPELNAAFKIKKRVAPVEFVFIGKPLPLSRRVARACASGNDLLELVR